MSAMPDLRLQAPPEVKSKAKQPAKAPEPRKNEASGFAEVYAKERQSKSAERSGPTNKPAEGQSAPANGEPAASAETADESSDLAAAGNSLPVEDEGATQELDPLLAMVLGDSQTPVEAPPATDPALAMAAPVLAAGEPVVADVKAGFLPAAICPNKSS